MSDKQPLSKVQKSANTILHIIALFFAINLFFSILDLSEKVGHYTVLFGIIILACSAVCESFKGKFSYRKLLSLLPDAAIIFLFIVFSEAYHAFVLYIIGRQTLLFIKNFSLMGSNSSLLEKLAENPPGFLIFSFIITIFAGTILLLLPNSTVDGSIKLLDALFTATSATCVTGLIVRDTGTYFTLYGQIIILLLIQVGGLGIMTISSAFAVIIGQKLTVKSEHLIQNVVGESNRVDMAKLVKSIILVTFIIELIGATVIYFSLAEHSWSVQKAVYHSVFHSVSAFCNAGFSLYSDSFMGYYSSININFAITFLIILGGIGFPVMVDLQRNFKSKASLRRLTLHTKIVLTTTAALIVLGMLSFFISEYYETMHGFNLKDRLLASFFQSVTTRTAGFNTIDTGAMSHASIFVSMILMFIGASPGSTGGGIKTTTFFVLLFSVFTMMSGNKDVNIFHRRVSEDVIKKVMAVVALSILILSFMVFLLFIIEPYDFDETLFEAVSAFGTVGLSTGITSGLSDGGKIIIILLMYIGRVGPLTMVLAFSQANMKTSFQLVEEKITIG